MRLRGVSKEPGCSWVELQNRVHVFVVGDQHHPYMEDINTQVRRLTKHMNDEGYRPASRYFGDDLELDMGFHKNGHRIDSISGYSQSSLMAASHSPIPSSLCNIPVKLDRSNYYFGKSIMIHLSSRHTDS
uniref:Pentatricopeptide repeat-containing protein n=1 Tax=Ananas comosus var. bracteatus TaxID=296719 RepID=A0A6V7PEU1_ANACO|nr:unnamed protein product [Ananas comosus var. bracteatus]